MAYNTALFDLDGTLVKTDRAYYNKMIKDIFNKPKDINGINDKIIGFWASTQKESYAINHFGMPLETLLGKFREHEDIGLRKELTKEFNDTHYLAMLKYLGFKIGIVTGAPKRVADFEIEMLPVKPDIVIIAAQSSGIKSKPDPEGLFIALKFFGSSFMQSFYVGNATEDILAAKAAGVLDIFIDRGYNSTDAEPTHRIKTLYELEKIIHNI